MLRKRRTDQLTAVANPGELDEAIVVGTSPNWWCCRKISAQTARHESVSADRHVYVHLTDSSKPQRAQTYGPALRENADYQKRGKDYLKGEETGNRKETGNAVTDKR